MFNTIGLDRIQTERRELAIKKNNDYSGNKIDNLSITGIQGIAVRLIDKVSRIYNLTTGGKQMVNDESIRDTLMDIANYADFGVMMLDNTWGKDEHKYIIPENGDTLEVFEYPPKDYEPKYPPSDSDGDPANG